MLVLSITAYSIFYSIYMSSAVCWMWIQDNTNNITPLHSPSWGSFFVRKWIFSRKAKRRIDESTKTQCSSDTWCKYIMCVCFRRLLISFQSINYLCSHAAIEIDFIFWTFILQWATALPPIYIYDIPYISTLTNWVLGRTECAWLFIGNISTAEMREK